MKKVFLLLALALLSISTASALEPIKVAIVNTGTAPVSVEIRLNNYTGGTATLLYTQPATNYTPNGSGIIIANISGAGWTAIASNTVTNYHILDVYVGASLVAQYRLDNLLLSQSQGGIFDIEGNLSPSESGAGSVGTDDNRWGELYVTGNTVHIGPTSGEAGNTELALSYNGGTAKMTVDNTDVLTATSSGVTIPGTLTATGVTTLGNLTGAGTRNIAVNASGEVVVAESAVNTDATINGNGTTGSPLSLADNAVATAKINDGAVTTTKINNDAVTTGKIATGAVTTDKIGSSAVTDVKIGSSAVTTAKINDGAVTTAKISSTGAASGNVLTYNGTNVTWATPGGSTVSTNATINGDGSGGSPLGINLANSNTWTANQTFGGTFLITSNSRIAMTNSDNNARDIRFQEPSGTGSQYIGWRAPSVSQNSNYVFPTAIGTPGQVLAINTVGAFGDSATTHWITPSGGGTVSTNATINGDGSGGSPLGINLANSNTWTGLQIFANAFSIFQNARIALTNNDNNARDIRWQEPSGTGSQYIGWRAPSVSKNSNYVFPTAIGTPGQVLAINTVGSFGDSATTHWVTPSGGGSSGLVTTNTMTGTISPLPTHPTYSTAGGISLSLDANTTYLVRGFFQEKEIGGTSGTMDIKLNYTGNISYTFFESLDGDRVLDESNIEALANSVDNQGDSPSYIEGLIRTNTSGTLTIQFRKNTASPNDVEVLDAELSVIKM